MIVILSGSSGAGKNTIISALLKGAQDKYALMPTVTTRAMREGECEGMPYHFTDREDFLRRADAGEFIEYETVHGNLYGTSKKVLAASMGTGKILLKDIDVYGTLNLSDRLRGSVKVVTVFITVDADTLRERLRLRGDSPEEIEKRLSRFALEQAYADKYDYTVHNDDFTAAVEDVRKIIEKESR